MKIVADAQSDYMGIFTFDPVVDNANAFDAAANQNVAIVHTHIDWIVDGAPQFFDTLDPKLGYSVADLARTLAQQDSVLALSWDPMSLDFVSSDLLPGGEQPALSANDILSGGMDAYIRQVAQQVADIDVPIMLNLFGEADSAALFAYGPDGNQFRSEVTDQTGEYGDPTLLDGPERVRDMFKHVIDIFNAEGVTNVTWFMYMANGLMTQADSIDPAQFYPGDDYIDWVGQSLYIQDGRTLEDTFDAGYNAWGAVTDKPFFIPEMGFETTSGDKISALLDALQGYDRVSAYTWADFDGQVADWNVARLGSSAGDWAALGAATGLLDHVTLEVGPEQLALDDWYVGAGLAEEDRTFNGTAGSDNLLGSAGADLLYGGTGDDTYLVNHAGDEIFETGGYDTVLSHVDHVLAEGVEMLQLQGTGALEGRGNALGNTLVGNDAANVLRGMAGDDVLRGEGGNDTMHGGGGNDTFFVTSSSDVVVEGVGWGQNDTVVSTQSYRLPKNVETLVLEGTGNTEGFGNGSHNTLLGNDGNNRLIGGGGNDTLKGGAGDDKLFANNGDDVIEGGSGNDTLSGGDGNDTLSGGAGDDKLVLTRGADFAEGGAGADTFVFRSTEGDMAVIGDFTAGEDVLDMTAMGIDSHAALDAAAYDGGGGVLITLGADQLFLSGLSMSEFQDSLVLI